MRKTHVLFSNDMEFESPVKNYDDIYQKITKMTYAEWVSFEPSLLDSELCMICMKIFHKEDKTMKFNQCSNKHLGHFSCFKKELEQGKRVDADCKICKDQPHNKTIDTDEVDLESE